MLPRPRSELTLAEWLVLCLVSERPRHSFAIARLLAQDGSLGQVWYVPKAMVYRSAQRLEQLGLITSGERQPSTLGPARSELQATAEGQQAAQDWMRQPATHARDIRSELLIKLALLDRAGADPRELLRAQRGQLTPIARTLASQAYETAGFEHTLALWRHESISATLRFLDALLVTVPPEHPKMPAQQTRHEAHAEAQSRPQSLATAAPETASRPQRRRRLAKRRNRKGSSRVGRWPVST